MRWITRAAVAVAVAGGGLAARRLLANRDGAGSRTGSAGHGPLWHVVTVYLPQDEVAPDGRLPEPLAELGDDVEVRLRPAPGDRGTEIAVRLRDEATASGLGAVRDRLRGTDPRWAVRRALREAKSLLETGEVLHPDRPTTTEPTPLNRPLAFATKHGREGGIL